MTKKALYLFLTASCICILSFSFLFTKESRESFFLLKETVPRRPMVDEFSFQQQMLKKLPKAQRIEGRLQQELELTRDPNTGDIPRERLITARNTTQNLLNNKIIEGVSWEERGPNNVGGRTRSILMDKNDATNNTVFAGSVSGGLWKTTNFQSSNPTWTHINDFFDNISISSIIQDPVSPNILYFGTGEYWGGIRGMGAWKSIDNGLNWNLLPSTTSFRFIQDLLLDNNGNLYITTVAGLFQSTNSGASWQKILGHPISANDRAMDLELGADGSIYVSFGYGNTGQIFRSATGAFGSWINISPPGDFWRIELSTAPSDANRIYAFCQGANSNEVTGVFRSTNKGNSWTALPVPTICQYGETRIFTRGQAWWDLISVVAPNDPNIVFAGGVDAVRSTDGGNTWTQITSWGGGLSCDGLNENQYVHADQHVILFENGNNTKMIWGTDGGITHTTNGMANLPTFVAKNNNYNVTQFYACAVHPTENSNYMLAGSQDNGTQRFTIAGLNHTTQATGGDGAGKTHLGALIINELKYKFRFKKLKN